MISQGAILIILLIVLFILYFCRSKENLAMLITPDSKPHPIKSPPTCACASGVSTSPKKSTRYIFKQSIQGKPLQTGFGFGL